MTSEVDKSFPSSCDHLLSSKSVLSFEFFKFTVTDRLRVRSEKSTQDGKATFVDGNIFGHTG